MTVKRTEMLRVRLTEQEFEIIKKAAEKSSLSISEFVREQLLDPSVAIASLKKLKIEGAYFSTAGTTIARLAGQLETDDNELEFSRIEP